METDLSKYYTPTIEEFCYGFDFEHESLLNLAVLDVKEGTSKPLTDKNRFVKCSFYKTSEHMWSTIGYDVLPGMIEDKKIRVKYLDREDIESLGWEGDEMEVWKDDERRFLYHKKCTTPRGEQNCSILHVPHTNWVMIYFSTGEYGSYVWELPEDKITFTGSTAFAGVIKNKSELKRILTQIGVI